MLRTAALAALVFVIYTVVFPEASGYGGFGYGAMQMPRYSFASVPSMSYGPYGQQPYQFRSFSMPPMSLPLTTSPYGSPSQLSMPYLTPRASPITSSPSYVLRTLANYFPQTQQTTYRTLGQTPYLQRPQPQRVYMPAATQPQLHLPYSPSLYMLDQSSKKANLVQTVSSRPVQPAASYRVAAYHPASPGQSGATMRYLSGVQSQPSTVTLQLTQPGPQLRSSAKSLNGLSYGAECDWVGQFLRDPMDTCSYQVCSYAAGRVKADGSIPLLPRRRSCPTGTAVPPGYTGGATPPCSVRANTCQAGPSSTSVHPSIPYAQVQAPSPGNSLMKAPTQAGPQLLRHMVQVLTGNKQTKTNVLSAVGVKSSSDVGCQKAGQFSRNPVDKCSYYVCSLGPISTGGEAGLVRSISRCPPGSAVPVSFSGGAGTPCSQVDNTCGHSPAQPAVAPKLNTQLIKQLQTAFLQPQTPQVSYTNTRYGTVSASVNSNMASLMSKNQLDSSNIQPQTASCQLSGQFMRDPADRCRYLVCSGGMPTLEGSSSMVVTRAPCPPGTAVPPSFQTGYTVPCTVTDHSCMGSKQILKSQGHQYQPQTPQASFSTKMTRTQNNRPTNLAFSQSGQCQTVGHYLPMPGDKCSYRVCTAGPQTPDGKPTLAAQRSACPPGTSVPPGYNGGQDTPCSVIDASCSGM